MGIIICEVQKENQGYVINIILEIIQMLTLLKTLMVIHILIMCRTAA